MFLLIIKVNFMELGKPKLSSRLLRHFNLIWISDISSKNLEFIYTKILQNFLEKSKIFDQLKKIS